MSLSANHMVLALVIILINPANNLHKIMKGMNNLRVRVRS